MPQDGNALRLRRRPGPRASWPAAGISDALRSLPLPLSFSQAGTHFSSSASASASSEASWSASECTDQSSDSESVAHSRESSLADDEGESYVLSADGDASPPHSPHGRRTPEFALPELPLRSFKARPPSHRKRPSQIHVMTGLVPAKDNKAAGTSNVTKPTEDTSSPISPTTDWDNFVELFKSARTSLGPTDAISVALSSPSRRPVKATHSRKSSRATTSTQDDSDSSVDEDREREETLRKAEEYFFSGRSSHEGVVP